MRASDLSQGRGAYVGGVFAPYVRDMVARGETGKKSGKGFYDWSE